MNNKYKILIVEDEHNIINFVTALLETGNYQVISATTCASGLMLCASHHPDLIILDLGLPDSDGMEFLKKVRQTSVTPVIVLSARTAEQDKVAALDHGANDYITKPFGSQELMARVRSVLRTARRGIDTDTLHRGIFQADCLKIDYDARRVFIDTTEIKLTQTEYNILELLSQHAGKVLTYSTIIKAIWGYHDAGSTKKLQVNMANIRKKFGAKPGEKNYIVNELGVGYRMCERND